MRLALALALIAFPAYAADSVKPDAMCAVVGGVNWCRVKYDTLKQLLEGAQRLQAHNAYVETLCGWRKL